MSRGMKAILFFAAAAVGIYFVWKAIVKPKATVNTAQANLGASYYGAQANVANAAGVGAANVVGTIANGIANSISSLFGNSTQAAGNNNSISPIDGVVPYDNTYSDSTII